MKYEWETVLVVAVGLLAATVGLCLGLLAKARWSRVLFLGLIPFLGVTASVLLFPTEGRVCVRLVQVYSVACVVGFCIRMIMSVRALSANKQGRCRGCGYELRGVAPSQCPECGLALTPAPTGAPTEQDCSRSG